ncbi:MAG: hypothetical protein GX880_10695 [Methanomicrobiales archaeon]|nr:hypothetical protein [Methanomicrobiales archaeon]
MEQPFGPVEMMPSHHIMVFHSGIRRRNSEKMHLFVYCDQSRTVKFAVNKIKELLSGEIELFCHTGEQLIADLFFAMGDPCTDSCITTVMPEYQLDMF